MRLPDHRTVMGAEYHGLLRGVNMLVCEGSKAHGMVIGGRGAVVQQAAGTTAIQRAHTSSQTHA